MSASTRRPVFIPLLHTLIAGCTAILLTGISDCDGSDADGDGYPAPEDCNDTREDIYPGAPELCDGIDQDCDGTLDEGFEVGPWYPDADGDGFGDTRGPSITTCMVPTGYSISDADCNDANASIKPGAVDVLGDGVDTDCGGTDAAEPSVGLPASTFTSLQAALDAAPNNPAITVWVGPGTYPGVEVSFRGKSLRLKGTHGRTQTIVDGEEKGTVFYFNAYEGVLTALEGFTITGGVASLNCDVQPDRCDYIGGGILVDTSAPRFYGLTLTGNSATYGGGMFVSNGSPILTKVEFHQNQASGQGGGLVAYQTPNLTLEDCSFFENTALTAGGLAILQGDALLERVVIANNGGSQSAGGITLSDSNAILRSVLVNNNATGGDAGGMDIRGASTPSLYQVQVRGNTAGPQGYGGGIYINSATPRFTLVEVTDNWGQYGGGITIRSATPSLNYVRITNNIAGDSGGALMLSSSYPTLNQAVMTGNSAPEGGALWLDNANPTVTQSILAYNKGRNIFRSAKNGNPSKVTTSTSNFYNPPTFGTDNLTPTGTFTSVEPAFLIYRNADQAECEAGSSDGCLPSDLHLALTSPLVNTGDPTLQDQDGSPSDPGLFGGTVGATWDRDGDGEFDWFWPGTIDDAPTSINSADYDLDDAYSLTR